ncbi:hypothetical protein LFL97_06305 [Burkholderia sp. JSH-S8]|nr:hypothetical protein LFL97_06305 [Burkholderia sp. JSH-S8]
MKYIPLIDNFVFWKIINEVTYCDESGKKFWNSCFGFYSDRCWRGEGLRELKIAQ